MRRALVLAPLALVGCSLLGLEDYPIGTCHRDPSTIDPCAVLCDGNAACTTCVRYQCDANTSRCVLGPKDADGDGDPDAKCGGGDCRDDNPRISSKNTPETVCNGVDDNCNLWVDEGLLRPGATTTILVVGDAIADVSIVRQDASAGAVVSAVRKPSAGTSCIALGSDLVATNTGTCATFAMDPGSPAQPYSRFLGATFPPVLVTVFSRIDACDALALRSAGGGADTSCAQGPHSLPAIIGVSDTVGRTATDALVTYYATVPVADCASTVAAPLQLAQVDATTTNRPLINGATKTLSSKSRSTRPASLVAARDQGILIAAPDEAAGAMVWLVHQITGDLEIASFPMSIPGARSIDAAISPATGSAGGVDDVALVVAIGCPPAQSVVLALGSVAYNGQLPRSFELTSLHTIGSGGAQDASPSIAWVGAPYSEWRVTWKADDGVRMARFTAGGDQVGAPYPMLGNYVTVPTLGSHGNIVYAKPSGFSTVESIAVGCP